MIYNPGLNLSRDEIIVNTLAHYLNDQKENEIVHSDELNIIILRGIFARKGLYFSAKQLSDIWLFRQGWL